MKKISMWKRIGMAVMATALVSMFASCGNPVTGSDDDGTGDTGDSDISVKISGKFTTDDKGFIDLSENEDVAAIFGDVSAGDLIITGYNSLSASGVGTLVETLYFEDSSDVICSTMNYVDEESGEPIENIVDAYYVTKDDKLKGFKIAFFKPAAAVGADPDPLTATEVEIKNFAIKIIKASNLDKVAPVVADVKSVALIAQVNEDDNSYAGSMQGNVAAKTKIPAGSNYAMILKRGAIAGTDSVCQYAMDTTNWNWQGSMSSSGAAGTYVTVGHTEKEIGSTSPWGSEAWCVGIQCAEDALKTLDSVVIRILPKL